MRTPKAGETWYRNRPGGQPVVIAHASAELVVYWRASEPYVRRAAEFMDDYCPPKQSLAEYPNLPGELWVNLYPGSKPGHVGSATERDNAALPGRVARIRLVPDPEGIVRCEGRKVLS